MKDSANALKELEAAIGRAADQLANDGLYIDGIQIRGRYESPPEGMMASFPQRQRYRREISVRLTNEVPDYVRNP